MNQETLRENIHAGIDRHCASLTADPHRVQRVLRAANKGDGFVVRKKKLSVSLVFAALLLLAGTAALAAIGLGQLYEHVIRQEGQSGLIKDWRVEDKIALIDRMLEAGIELDPAQIDQLHHGDLTQEAQDALAWRIIASYYPARDGTLTSIDIIAKEKGPIEKWSLEDRAWLSQMIDHYQPEALGSGANLIPGQEDLSQAQALEIFYQYYAQTHRIARSAFDEDTATFAFGESEFDDGSGPVKMTRWVINMRLHSGEELGAYIGNDGEILSAIASNRLEADWKIEADADMLSDDFLTVDGMYRFEQKWRSRLEALIAAGEDVEGTELFYMLDGKRYGHPGENDITREEAYSIACQALIAQNGWSESSLQYYDQTAEAYRTEDPDGAVYWITFQRIWSDRTLSEEARELGYPVSVTVKVSPEDGTVKEISPAGLYYEKATDRFGMEQRPPSDRAKRGRNLMPTDADIRQEDALAVFFDYYLETYGLGKDAFLLDTLTAAFGEGPFSDGETDRYLRHWTFNVDVNRENVDSEIPVSERVGAHISSTGEVIDAYNPFMYSWRDRWYDDSMDEAFWTIEGIYRTMSEWKPLAKQLLADGERLYVDLEHLITVNFALPKEGDLPEEEAVAIAAQAVRAALDIDADFLRYFTIRRAYFMDENDNGVYFLWFQLTPAVLDLPAEIQEKLDQVAVYVDADTGDVLRILPGGGDKELP